MTECKGQFSFNTAITAIDEATGRWDDDAHRVAILPLRGKIMQIDGVFGVYIDRYCMAVDFMSGVTDLDILEREITRVMEWAATQESLFPLRGDKTPTATLERPASSAPRSSARKVIARFNTHLVAYPVSAANDFDESAFNAKTRKVVQALTDTEGVVACQIALNGASLTVDTKLTDVETVQEHMRTVLSNFAGILNDDDIFPYIDSSSDLNLTFSVGNADE